MMSWPRSLVATMVVVDGDEMSFLSLLCLLSSWIIDCCKRDRSFFVVVAVVFVVVLAVLHSRIFSSFFLFAFCCSL